MENHVKNINEMFENDLGENFKDLLQRNNTDTIDWEKVKYNSFYRDFSFYENKFPKGYNTIPAFDKVIEMIVEKNSDNSPLKEYYSINNIEDNNNECNKQISDNA